MRANKLGCASCHGVDGLHIAGQTCPGSPRTRATAWTDGGSTFSNAALIQFPQATGGTNAITHFSVVTTSSGAGQILVSGALSATLNVTSGIQPQFAIGELDVTAD